MFVTLTPADVLTYLDHVIMAFQLNDLRKASMNAEANFLVAIGCMHTIEFLGGVETELLGKKGNVENRFKAGIRLLSGKYINPPSCDEEIMYELRNGLTHQYVAAISNVRRITIMNDWQTEQAVSRDSESFTLNVAQLIKDLGMAWAKLRISLEKDSDKLTRLAVLLNSLPFLRITFHFTAS
jgi:hypothetical protein